VPKAGHLLDEALLGVSGTLLLTEKRLPHAVIDANDRVAVATEVLDYRGADQTTGSRHHNRLRHLLILPSGEEKFPRGSREVTGTCPRAKSLR